MYEMMGINISDLRCVMADVDSSPFHELVDIKDEHLFRSDDPERPWMDGCVCKENPHVTVLYGLLDNYEVEYNVKTVLEGWTVDEVTIDSIEYFEGDDHYCVVGAVAVTPELLEGHQRLELLPHINTHAGYIPHITIAYIQKDEAILNTVMKSLAKLEKTTHKVTDINMGAKKKIIELKDIKK
jgi:2'-5' RNA ligase